MIIVKPLHIYQNWQTILQNTKSHCIFTAAFGINLQAGDPLLEFDSIKDTFSCMDSKPLPDTDMPKPNGEFIVFGNYSSKNQQPTSGGEVRVVIVNEEKSFLISGPRIWQSWFPTKPEGILMFQLDYTNFFVGAQYGKNQNTLTTRLWYNYFT